MANKVTHSKSLGKTGIAFSSRESKEVRESFEPQSPRDYLAVFIDGIKIAPKSWDQFGDKNLRSGSKSQAFNLRWIKNGGAKLDQLAEVIRSEVVGFSNHDESYIINEVVDLIREYPTGMSEYFFSNNNNNAESDYYTRMEAQEQYDNTSDIDNELFKSEMKKRFKKPAKKQTTKQQFTKEFKLLKRFLAMAGKRINVSQLHRLHNALFDILPNIKWHKALIKQIHAKIGVAIYNLGANEPAAIDLTISPPLLKQIQAVVTEPKVKSVTLGNTNKELNLNGLFGIEQYTKSEAIELGIIDINGTNLSGIDGKAKNPYDVINRIIIKQINNGVIPWEQPWTMDQGNSVKPQNLISKREYRGVNFWGCLGEMEQRNHAVPYFLTSKQINDSGGQIRKGAKPYYITYYGKFIATTTKTNKETKEPETEANEVKFLKLYAVYNVEDTTGINYTPPDNKPAPIVERIEAAEAIIKNMPNPPKMKFGGNSAFYSPTSDLVQMPKIEYFKVKDRYYSTFFHELVHSTKNDKRCGTDAFRKNSNRFGDKQYSWEELVAELGACYLCGEAGILHKTVQHSAAYAKGWANSLTKYIGDDKTYFFKAANYAQKAADYILNKTEKKEKSTPGSNAKKGGLSGVKFNKELLQFKRGKFDANHQLNLGLPSDILQWNGVPNKPILLAKSVIEKATKDKHLLLLEHFINIDDEIKNPLAIIKGSHPKSIVVLTELKDLAKNPIIVALRFNIQSKNIEINQIASAYGKHLTTFRKWAREGKIVWENENKKTALSAFLALLAKGRKKRNLSGIDTENTNVQKPTQKPSNAFTSIDKVQSGGTFSLNGELGKFLPDLGNHECSITLEGDQGAGKSQLAWMLADGFAEAGKTVAFISPEMSRTSPVISKYRDQFIKPENQSKILFNDDSDMTAEGIKKLASQFDVVIVDSFTKLKNYDQFQFTKLFKSIPDKIVIGLFQRTTSGEIRGGNTPVFDAYVNIEVVKVDETFVNNYAVCTKNRFGATGDRFNISRRKIIKAEATPKKAIKKKEGINV